MAPGAAFRNEPIFKMGENGLEVPMELHKLNRTNLCQSLQKLWDNNFPKSNIDKAYVLLQAACNVSHGGSDVEVVFRQESFFHWAFGGLEPDWFGAINILTERTILFVPRVPESAAIYIGSSPSCNEIARMYSVDEVYYDDQIAQFFTDHETSLLLTLYGLNSDSGNYTCEAKFDGIEKFSVNNDVLHNAMCECRVIKTDLELKVIEYAVKRSSMAHRHLMRNVKPGMHQFQAESLFLHYCYFLSGMRHVGYTCIAATGCDCAVLHYGHAGAPNERLINDGDMCLFDMGGEYYCYCSDITCSWPVNGRFDDKQRLIYETVLAAVNAVVDCLKPGIKWPDMHRLAERIMLGCLVKGGLLIGNVDEMMEVNLGAVFMPHGLGHFMGCDVHDVGGYLKNHPPRLSAPGLKNLRTARSLKANMVITVEPGCYFIDLLLKNALSSPNHARFMVESEISKFKNFGGVRIEEDVLITEHGCKVMSDVPRTVDEIEHWMSLDHTDFDTIKL